MTQKPVSHIHKLIGIWSQLQLPLRPREPVPSNIAALLPGRHARLLILGVTPEYADLTDDVVALDQSHIMIHNIWPGNTATRHAVQGDWRAMPFADAGFDVVAGDNSPSLLAYPDDLDSALAETRRVLRPGGIAILRWFLAPYRAATDSELIAFANGLTGQSVDVLRWRLAIHAVHATGNTNVLAGDAWDEYMRLFPDTEALRQNNAWSADEIGRMELYRGSGMALSFPTRAQMHNLAARHFETVTIRKSGDYPMAEFGPFVVLS